MELWKKKKEAQPVPVVQLRSGERHPFSALDRYVPLRNGETQLYQAVREAVPLVDAALYKLVRLTSGVKAICDNAQTETALMEFLRTVPVGRGQRGINTFLDAYLNSMLLYGRGVGEIVLDKTGREVLAVLCERVDQLEIREGENPMETWFCGRDSNGKPYPLPAQDLVLFTPFNAEAESPYGVSLLRSMPFLSEVLVKIYHTIGLNWERCGNVRFAVTYKPDGETGQAMAQERSEKLAREWSEAMASGRTGSVRDFVAVGDVDIKVIGADNQVLDSQVPVRQILEQLIAKTGIPPFMLGLSWSATERMSAQQADLLTTEITAIRRTLTPVLDKICKTWLRAHGLTCAPKIVWDDINLQDQVEESRAALYREQARKLQLENDEKEKQRRQG